jgi:hypothetical protein
MILSLAQASQDVALPGGNLLIASYIALWALLLAVLLLILKQQRDAMQDVEELERRLNELHAKLRADDDANT